MAIIRWLHLTDLHRGMKEQNWLWPNVKDFFFNDLAVLHEKSKPWDLVLFTGDLTRQGSVDEFKEVDELLEQLRTYLQKLGSSPQFLAVPGNHDLVRPEKKIPAVKLLQQWENQSDVQSEFWEDEQSPYREVIRQAFGNYTSWWYTQSLEANNINIGILPGDFSVTIEKEGVILGIVGLNTAFLQLTDDNYEGKLALHVKQFHEVCGGNGPEWVKQHHACLLLTHHPPTWLNVESQKYLNAEITAYGRFALHLCGHMHEATSCNTSIAGTEPRRIWQGRSLFGLEYFGKEEKRLHGYSVGEIDLHGDTETLLFWPRKDELQGGQRSLVPDQSLTLKDNQHTSPINIHSPVPTGLTYARLKPREPGPKRKFTIEQIAQIQKKVLLPKGSLIEPMQIFEASGSLEFITDFKRRALEAKRIVLIGIALNFLWKDDVFRNSLIDKAAEGDCELEIYLANPYSPSIETRLIEEEIRKEVERPLIGKRGIIGLIEAITERYKDKQKAESTFSFKIFSNYLTLALLILDDQEYFFYPYGYARLGNFSPVMQYSRAKPDHTWMVDFLTEHYNRIKSSAIDAQIIYNLPKVNKEEEIDVQNLLPFAVYFVPEVNSALYKFGSEVLGYDIRHQSSIVSQWPPEYIGEARNYGFHLTLADALYFAHQSDIQLVTEEIKNLVQGFIPFQLDFRIQAGFPNKESISLVCFDENGTYFDKSGTLEALHHELVFRCYRRAIGSNYDLRLVKPDRDQDEDRADLMIQRYHAPYIFNCFRPHFTLLTKVPPEKLGFVSQEISELFKKKVPEPHIKVKRIAILERPDLNQPWKIRHEIKLGR